MKENKKTSRQGGQIGRGETGRETGREGKGREGNEGKGGNKGLLEGREE
jgi:hypothetical protein